MRTAAKIHHRHYAKPAHPAKEIHVAKAHHGGVKLHASVPSLSRELHASRELRLGDELRPSEPFQAGPPADQAEPSIPDPYALGPDENATGPSESKPAREPRVQSASNCAQIIKTSIYWEGRMTASGQPFNPEGMTAAHRTLPFGSRLTVMNPRTGRSVTVVINDRGPYVRGVGLDLSRGAARAIGMRGTEHVCVS